MVWNMVIARIGEVDVRLVGNETAVAIARNIVLSEFAEHLVSEDGSELEEVVIRSLREKGWMIAVAEMVRRMICSRLTDIPAQVIHLRTGLSRMPIMRKPVCLGWMLEF